MADGGRIGFEEAGPVQKKINVTKKKRTTKRLFDFLKTWINEERKPTITEVSKGSGTSTISVKKYLKEGTDYTKISPQEAGKRAGTKSGAAKSKVAGVILADDTKG